MISYIQSVVKCTLKCVGVIIIVSLQVSHEQSNIGSEFHNNIDTFYETMQKQECNTGKMMRKCKLEKLSDCIIFYNIFHLISNTNYFFL